jgi:Spy/CpxP family protein refolding chaperone
MKRPLNCGGFAAAALLICSSAALAQSTTAATSPAAAPAGSASAGTSKQNLSEDIKLLRKDVRQQKEKIMGAAMGLDDAQSKKFWPIYRDYNRELNKLNDARLGNITAFAQNYSNMTDNKADEIVNGAFAYHKKRIDLLANTYDKVRAALGSPLAARFVQVESTLNNLIDLQIQSNLPLMWGPEK